MANPELIVKISGNSEKFRKELNKIEKQSDESVKRMQKRAAVASAAVAASVAGGLVAFNSFRNFERDFTNVVTLLDDTSFKTKTLSKGIGDLKGGLKKLSAESGESFDTLNKGLFDLISAGVDAESAISALGVATKLALAGGTDTSVAVDGLTSALNAYNLEADQAQSVSEKFFTAQKFGKTTIEELSGSFGQVGATAASLNISLDEVLASVSAVTTAGVGTSEAFTGLKAVLANVIKPTKDARIEAQALGIEFTAASLRSKGLAGFLDEITQSAGYNKDSLGKLFGSVEALNVVTALAGNQSDEFADTLAALGDEAGSAATFQEALAVKTETADQKIKRMQQAVAAAAVTLGEFVSPAVLFFAEQTTIRITELGEGFQALGVIVGGVATIISEAWSSAIGFILSGISQVDARIATFVAGLNDAIAKVPFLSDEKRAGLEGRADNLRDRAAQSEFNADTFAAGATQFFTDQDVEEQLDRQRGFNDAKNELLAEQLEAERDIRIENEELNRDEGISDPLEAQTDEEFEETSEEFRKRLSELAEKREEDRKAEITAAKKAAKERQKIEEEKAKKLAKIDEEMTKGALKNLKTLVDEQTAAGKAIFLFEQAQAIAQTIMNTREAMTLAIATLPPPAGEAKAAQYAVFGALQVATIAAQTVQGVSAQKGGIVAGVGSGDKIPAMLEAGEIVVPRKFNPLSPNFEETFIDGVGGVGGAQRVTVDLNLDENAARILTAQQRENKAIGVSR